MKSFQECKDEVLSSIDNRNKINRIDDRHEQSKLIDKLAARLYAHEAVKADREQIIVSGLVDWYFNKSTLQNEAFMLEDEIRKLPILLD